MGVTCGIRRAREFAQPANRDAKRVQPLVAVGVSRAPQGAGRSRQLAAQGPLHRHVEQR